MRVSQNTRRQMISLAVGSGLCCDDEYATDSQTVHEWNNGLWGLKSQTSLQMWFYEGEGYGVDVVCCWAFLMTESFYLQLHAPLFLSCEKRALFLLLTNRYFWWIRTCVSQWRGMVSSSLWLILFNIVSYWSLHTYNFSSTHPSPEQPLCSSLFVTHPKTFQVLLS